MEITWTYNWLETIAIVGMGIIGFILLLLFLVRIVLWFIVKSIFRNW